MFSDFSVGILVDGDTNLAQFFQQSLVGQGAGMREQRFAPALQIAAIIWVAGGSFLGNAVQRNEGDGRAAESVFMFFVGPNSPATGESSQVSI